MTKLEKFDKMLNPIYHSVGLLSKIGGMVYFIDGIYNTNMKNMAEGIGLFYIGQSICNDKKIEEQTEILKGIEKKLEK